MATYFPLFNLVLLKKKKKRLQAFGMWLITSALEGKLLGAQCSYVHLIIRLKAYFFAFPRSPTEFAGYLV